MHFSARLFIAFVTKASSVSMQFYSCVSRGEANMLKILPIILFHSAHKLSLLFL